jgi:hypothetical protein
MKLVRLTEMCVNKNPDKVQADKHLSDTFKIQNVLKQGDSLQPLLLSIALETLVGWSK